MAAGGIFVTGDFKFVSSINARSMNGVVKSPLTRRKEYTEVIEIRNWTLEINLSIRYPGCRGKE